MTRTERAEQLQREAGVTMDDYPFTPGLRSEMVYGLDKLKGVADPDIRKQLWDLYWLMEARR